MNRRNPLSGGALHFACLLLLAAGCAAPQSASLPAPAAGPPPAIAKAPAAKVAPPEPTVSVRPSSPHTRELGAVRAEGLQLVTVLTYHGIEDKPSSKLQVSTAEFMEQMDYLKKEGYRVIPLDHLFEFLNRKRSLPEKPVVITFDDGWKSVYTKGFPVLRKHGFPSTIFIYTDFIDTAGKALTWEMLREMQEGGVDVQLHSKTHEARIPWKREGESEKKYRERLESELLGPKKILKERLGLEARYLAYPYGQFNEEFVKTARSYGYEGGLTVFGATVKEGTVVRGKRNVVFVPPFEVRRLQVLSGTSLKRFKGKLSPFRQEKVYDGSHDHLVNLKGL